MEVGYEDGKDAVDRCFRHGALSVVAILCGQVFRPAISSSPGNRYCWSEAWLNRSTKVCRGRDAEGE